MRILCKLLGVTSDKDRLDFYIELTSKGFPLPKEWLKDCNQLAKKEQKKERQKNNE